MSRGERSRTLGWAYMMSPGSGEWSRPIRCPISCNASTRRSSGANGCPLASKVARVTTPPVRCPSSSHCRSVCPERSPSNWIRHWTRTSAELESASRLNRTGTPASCHRWNALRTASRKAGWKLATVVGGKYTRTGGDTRLSQRCRMESVLAATISFKYVLPALARIRRRSEEHTSELQSQSNLVCRLLLEKKKKKKNESNMKLRDCARGHECHACVS